MDTTQTITHVSLCAGYGGIDIGLKRAIPSLRTIAFSEIECFACANLVAKMEAGLLDAAPIWTNLKTFPWAEFRGRVDILSGGYPCQPFSAAGKRLGTDDPRHLWPFIADGIRVMQPRVCFFENVEGHISLGLREVIRELESIGYRATWGIFSAREVGAPHQRKRAFILAYRKQQGLEGLSRYVADWHEPGRVAAQSNRSTCACCVQPWPSRPGEPQHEWEPPRVVANSNSIKSSEGRGDNGEMLEVSARERTDECATLSGRESELRGEVVADSKNSRWHSQRIAGDMDSKILPKESSGNQFATTIANCGHAGSEKLGNAESRQDHGREPRDLVIETSQGGCRNYAANSTGEELGNANRSGQQEWQGQCGSGLQGTDTAGGAQPVRQAQPALGGNPDGSANRLDDAKLYVTCDNRTDELRLLGNGVVPATAELAFRILSERLKT